MLVFYREFFSELNLFLHISQYFVHFSLSMDECLTKFSYSTRIQIKQRKLNSEAYMSQKPLHDFVGENARGLDIYSNQFTNIFKSTGKKRARIKATTYDATVSHNQNELGEKERIRGEKPSRPDFTSNVNIARSKICIQNFRNILNRWIELHFDNLQSGFSCHICWNTNIRMHKP